MNKARILVADDEPGIREGCKRALTPHGFDVETAVDGEDALVKIYAFDYDLALIDVMMPGIGGIDLIARIQEHDPDIVCIIITGYATVELAVAAIKQGAYDFLTKPFTTDDLLHVVNQGLERRRLSLETKRLHAIEEEAQQLAEEKIRLEELDRAKVAFIRLVTHELQAPISAIATYLELILKGYISQDEQREYLVRAQERAQEQLALISDLLAFGKLKEVRLTSKPGLIQLEEILDKAIGEYEAEASEKKITLRVDIASDLPPVCIHADQAKSIWTNLISNAIKYTPSGGKVDILLTRDDSHLVGIVSDNGIGIPEEALERLFTEFYRAKNVKALNIPGTGLGLAIVREIVERSGGDIRVESEIDKGSKFVFELPVAEA